MLVAGSVRVSKRPPGAPQVDEVREEMPRELAAPNDALPQALLAVGSGAALGGAASHPLKRHRSPENLVRAKKAVLLQRNARARLLASAASTAACSSWCRAPFRKRAYLAVC